MRPLIEEIASDLDAFDIYSIFRDDRTVTLLESSMKVDPIGRYSFIGINPFTTFKYEEGRCFIDGNKVAGDPLDMLKKLLNIYKVDNDTSLPYVAGAMGFFSYDFGRILEKIPATAAEEVKTPDCYFYFYDNVIITDNLEKKTYIAALGMLSEKETSLRRLKDAISGGIRQAASEPTARKVEFIANLSKDEYADRVEKVRSYIRSGDVYITNLTQKFRCETEKDPYEVYRYLRRINPAPFSAFMNFEGFSIVSSSPERFLKVQDNKVETRPIKGTRPRGRNEIEDALNRQELLSSEKDKSELLMIVDLERNDLSRVCKPHTVKVTELFKLEEYSTVFHLVSTVTGELKKGFSAVDCIGTCFPGGSITGAPKVRSMEVIEELEPTRRNIYTGCLGYFGFDGNADFNIIIRTILMKDRIANFGVGGGITWESEKYAEYDETLDKARALMRALEGGETL
ncbi:aminodeoxychorismate synthase component I [Youngiibacter multivorans]|uniref:Anthranilate synthase component 1 n=1 Tax=Youngiibacter multivorans TaxID=937251 RepID=A0ABS4FZD1_9CLOT|nr:aminodeoxychorismate synthase component I [Youngiibacter multivorans]MBP1917644.1 para-aminobenzoate synthetase component 1 [Youngiibacter multivorans]